jgi:hypothetical protein
MSWLRGVVKEVPSGDTVVVAAGAKPGQVPAEKRITLSSLVAPKLVGACTPERRFPRHASLPSVPPARHGGPARG